MTHAQVGANIACDARKLFKDYEITVNGLEDLCFHAKQKLGGSIMSWSLASLTEKLLSKQVYSESNFLNQTGVIKFQH